MQARTARLNRIKGAKTVQDGSPPNNTQYYSIFEYAGVGVANVGFDGTIKDANAAFCELIGYPRSALLRMTFQAFTHPDDLDDNLHLLDELLSGQRNSYRMEKRYLRANGEILWADLTVTIEKDGEGKPCGLISIIQDIGRGKKNEERLNFLLGELAHRSKNLLTVVRATMRQIGRQAQSVGEFQASLDKRITGMAASQDLLFRNADNRTTLAELIREQLASFVGVRDPRVRYTGPDITLGPNAARILGMGLHELATNSCKYGALTAAEGLLSIDWHADETAEHIVLRWIERGGPPVAPPTRTGFGRKVTEHMVSGSLQGEVNVQFLPAGLEWVLTAPLSALQT